MKSGFYVQWHITNACSLRCRHCYQDDFSDKGDLSWLGLEQVAANLLKTLEGWGRRACIHLTGGEPVLKPELFPLLSKLDAQEAVEELGIITNGLHLDPEMTAKLSAFSKVKKIKISLDGPDAVTNDSIRGVGSFQRVERNVASIKKGGRLETFLMFTAMKRNFRSLPSFFRLGQEWRAEGIIIERFIPWGRGRGIRDEVLGKEEWRELVGSLYRYFSIDAHEGEYPSYQAFQIAFQGKEPELLGAPCVLGTDGLCIMPDATVFPCRRFPLAIGNLLTDPLKEIWERSAVLNTLRKRENLKGKCGLCQVQGCAGCRSLAFSLTGDFLAEDPHCGHIL